MTSAAELYQAGVAAAQAGELRRAVELVEESLALRPEWAEAWELLGRVLVNLGQPAQALEAYGRVAQLRPGDATSQYAIGLIQRDLRRTDESTAAFARAIALKPDFVEPYLKLGMLLRSDGRLDEAIALYRKLIEIRPALGEAHNNLANVLRDGGRVLEAIDEYLLAARVNPDDAITHFNLGQAYAALDQYNQALRAFQRAAALRPDDAAIQEALGATLLQTRDMTAAAGALRKTLKLAPRSAVAWNGLGLALRALGRFDEAANSFRRAIAIDPDNAGFHRNLASVAGPGETRPEVVDRLSGLAADLTLPVDERVEAGFALGKLLDDAGRFDESFAAYAQANSLFKAEAVRRGLRFDSDALRRTIDRMIANFTPAFFAERRDWGEPSELPVFVVGMPRSGTSLVEQIAASHSAVFGAGELRDLEQISAKLARGGDRASGEAWDRASVAAAARSHLMKLRALGGEGRTRVIDKMPGNVLYLGLIAVLFPGARVILCRRDARDTCLSCFFQHFDPRTPHPYIYDLADCARQHIETERLAEHWRHVLPLRILTVQYEQLVAEQEAQSRRLIEFLGLPWEEACLEFHRTERPVFTGSVWQVRQPMYAKSVGRWRRYEKHLQPLLEALTAT